MRKHRQTEGEKISQVKAKANQKTVNQTAGGRKPADRSSGHEKKAAVWKRYLAEEIGIELKACLYFFCILFYYSMYRLLGGSVEANIIHMAEMIFLTYGMGYAQVYLLANFDEGDCLRGKELLYILLCSLIYTGISYWGRWFDRNLGVTVGFTCYMIFAYVCAFLVYRLKREMDAKLLNEDLKAFQERRTKDGICDRD